MSIKHKVLVVIVGALLAATGHANASDNKDGWKDSLASLLNGKSRSFGGNPKLACIAGFSPA
ncbi:hypothetical protein NKH23_32770 [Mesorhizobium sp. M1328]|uniref:hypothetical protein n=1 Tax=Mesorhizobium sp. M1328 TaxID=2957082 RepID=UPI00333A12C8